MSLAAMKKQNSLDSLLGAAQKESAPLEKKSYVDERLWKPTMDKTGNGYAVIRFLPAPTGEDLPWVKLWNHAFQGPTGQWFIENSLTTLGNNDPVSEYNSKLWNSGIESDKEIARKQKRKLQYYSNIYVVSDASNPQNEGKVFLYRYGKKIFDKVMEAMQPPFPDTDPINPFDFWEGANFKLKLRKVDGYWNYDLSSFDGAAALSDDEDKLESVWGSEHSLSEFTAPSNFKTYDELKTRLDMVLSGVTKTSTVETLMEDEPTAPVKINTKPKPAPTVSTDDGDDAMSYFEKLAEG
jgi:hypothetical protein